MKFKIIKIEKGYVAITNEKIKEGDWQISTNKYITIRRNNYRNGDRKIIATTGFNLKGLPKFDLTTIPKENWGVHESHCCKFHGCKYGDEDCPVVLQLVEVKYSCEDCNGDDTYYSKADMKEAIKYGYELYNSKIGNSLMGRPKKLEKEINKFFTTPLVTPKAIDIEVEKIKIPENETFEQDITFKIVVKNNKLVVNNISYES